MKKKLLSKRHLIQNFNLLNYKWNLRATIIYKLTFISLLFFTSNFLQAQAVISQSFDATGTVIVPNGLTLMNIQAWGAGGSGGGAANAPNGEGRGGAGGGGGARATASITVTPGATIKAVVAGSVAGGPGNGTNGGSSTIEGYESFILASGGLGGPANTAGGSQAGGLGGSTGAGTITAGGQGGASGTSTLSILFSSGSGGSSPGGSGTTAGVGSIILGVNSAGYTGGIPGGGGTGAMNANNGAAQNGGASGHGRVIIGYTCPTYNFTTITADGACVSNGNTIVRLTGTAASLPVGTYNVTYSRTTPNATGQTATMTVSTAGSGTFTASGFTTVGTTSTVSVTAINSQACTSTKSSGNSTSVTVYAAPIGGSITGGSTICSGASSAPLTLSGHSGTVQKWQYAFSPFTTWNDLANSAGTSFIIGPLTQTTRFRAVVTNGTCTPATSSEVTVNVNPLPSLTVSSVTPVCFNSAAQTTALNYTNALQSPTTYSITWNTTPTNSFLAVTDAPLPANAISIAIPAGTTPGTYTGSLTVKNSNCTSAVIPFSVVINPLPTISTTGTVTAVCQSTANQTTVLPYTATTNTPTSYSIDWAILTDQGSTAISFSSGAGNITGINVPANTAPGTYTGTLTIFTANNCSVNQAISLVVNSLPQGSLSANGPFCATGAGQLTFTATAGSGPYTIVYNDGTADRTVPNVISGTPFNVFTTPVLGTTTYTLVSVTGANTCVRNSGFTGNTVTININPLPQGSLTANGPFCVTGAGQLTFTATAGSGPYTVVYNDGTADRTVPNVTSGTPFNVFTTPVTATTTYTLVSVTGANTCVRNSGFTGNTATINVNPLPQGSLTANGPFCVSGAGQLTFTATAGSGPYTVVYNDGTADRTVPNVTSGTPFNVFTTPVTATTTYTLVSVTGANTCVRNSGFTGNTATININPLPQGSLTANGPFCVSGAGQLTFTATAGSGPYTIVYNDGTADRTVPNVTSGTPFNVFTTPVTATTTYTLVSVTGANTCVRSSGFTGNTATININPLPQGSLTANGPFCVSGAGQLTFTATAGTGPYTVVYNDGTADRTVPNVTSGTPFNVFTTPVTATTTYTLVSVTGANTCVRSSGFTGNSAVITINSTPVPTFTAQAAASVCINTSQTYTTQSGQSNYVWTISGTPGTDYTILSGGTSNTSNSVTLQWNTIGNKTVTVGYSTNSCPSNASASNTTLVTKTERGVVNGGTSICSGSPSPLLTLNNYSGTIVRWEYAEAIPYVWQPISHTSNTYQPGILTTSTSFRAIVKNGTCPEETAIETRIDVEPKPSVPIFGTIVQPTCVNPVGSVVLNNLPASPNWTITQSGTVNQTYSSTGTTFTIANLAPGNYTFTIHNLPFCMSDPTINLEIQAPITNIWDGTSWSKGSPPIITDAIRFSGNYTLTGDLNGCSCVVDPGVNVTVGSNNTLTIVNSVTNSGGTFIFENNASLLQTTDAVNTGNIIYRRNTTPVRRYDFTRWSSPVTRTPAFKLSDLSPNTLGDKYYKYNGNTAAGWVIIGQGNEEMAKGVGYSIRAPQNYDINIPEVFYGEFIGVPNNGPVSIPLAGDEKWVLIGNPYPSAVYADRFIVDNQTNLYGTLYFWTHNSKPSSSVPGNSQYNYTEDDYAIYNLSGSTSPGSMIGDGASTPGNQSPPLGYIAAGQSFFVQSKTTATAVFTNSMRVPGSNSQFYKTIDSKKADEEKHRVWINLRNEQGAFKQILIGYVEGATNYWDNNYDAVTMNANKYLDFYSINEENKLVIQGRALPWQETDVVPLGYQANISGEFFVEIDHADGNLNSLPIFLKDNKTGAVHNLQNERYNFTTTIGTFDDRFSIHYSKSNLGIEDVEKTDRAIYVSVQNQIIKINTAAAQENIRDVAIYDVSGKLIFDKKNVNASEFKIETLNAKHQVLIVKTTLENGHIDSRKVIF